MASSLAHRAITDRTINLCRFTSNFLRSFSTGSPNPTDTAASASSPVSNKPKKRKKKNLFEVAQYLPNWGLGYHMAKTHWVGVSYQITKINLYKVCVLLAFKFSSHWVTEKMWENDIRRFPLLHLIACV